MTAEPQHMTALAKAHVIRLEVADVKRDLRRGGLAPARGLRDPRAQSMRVGDYLTALPRWGVGRTRKLLASLRIHEHKRIRELTRRQLAALVEALEPRRQPAPPALARPVVPPARADARVVATLIPGPMTRTELAMRLGERRLEVDDLDAALARLVARNAVTQRDAQGFVLYSVGGREAL